MAAAKRPAAKTEAPPTIEVILDEMEAKKHSIRFKTSEPGVAINSVYIGMNHYALLGRPNKLKLTITSAE